MYFLISQSHEEKPVWRKFSHSDIFNRFLGLAIKSTFICKEEFVGLKKGEIKITRPCFISIVTKFETIKIWYSNKSHLIISFLLVWVLPWFWNMSPYLIEIKEFRSCINFVCSHRIIEVRKNNFCKSDLSKVISRIFEITFDLFVDFLRSVYSQSCFETLNFLYCPLYSLC